MKHLAGILMPARPSLAHAALLVVSILTLRLCAYILVAGGISLFPQNMCQADCIWYMHLAKAGYDSKPLTAPFLNYAQANWTFFPAFSGLVAGLAALSHLPFEICGLIVSNAAFAGFTILGGRYLAAVRPGINEGACTLFLSAFPFSFYFSIPYTESLYAFLTTAVLYTLNKRWLMSAGGFSAVLLVTRVTGVLLWPALAWAGLAPAVRAYRNKRYHEAFSLALGAALPLAIAPLGLTLFMAYLYAHIGDALAFKHAQAGWLRTSENPISALVRGFLIFDVKDAVLFHASSQWLYAVSGFAGLALAVRLLWIGRYIEAWFLGATVLLAASAGILSLQRFVWANPVALLFLFDWLWQGKARRFMPVLLLTFTAIQLYFVYCWSLGRVGLV